MVKVGSSVGALYEFKTLNRETNEYEKRWKLVEDKVNKIVELKRGKKYYTKKRFNPLWADDVDSNTEQMEKFADGKCMLVKEVVELNDITRPMMESWVKWANENIGDVKSIFE